MRLISIILILTIFELTLGSTVVPFDCLPINNTLACNGSTRSWDFKPLPFNILITNVTSVVENNYYLGTYNNDNVKVDCSSILPNTNNRTMCFMRKINYTAANIYSIRDTIDGNCVTPQLPQFQIGRICGCNILQPDSAPQYYSFGKVKKMNCHEHDLPIDHFLYCYNYAEYDDTNFDCHVFFTINYEF